RQEMVERCITFVGFTVVMLQEGVGAERHSPLRRKGRLVAGVRAEGQTVLPGWRYRLVRRNGHPYGTIRREHGAVQSLRLAPIGGAQDRGAEPVRNREDRAAAE